MLWMRTLNPSRHLASGLIQRHVCGSTATQHQQRTQSWAWLLKLRNEEAGSKYQVPWQGTVSKSRGGVPERTPPPAPGKE